MCVGTKNIFVVKYGSQYRLHSAAQLRNDRALRRSGNRFVLCRDSKEGVVRIPIIATTLIWSETRKSWKLVYRRESDDQEGQVALIDCAIAASQETNLWAQNQWIEEER